MSDYELYNADCLDVFGQLAPGSVDAIICDPPYGTTACTWDSVIPFAPMWAGIRRVLKPRGACVLFGSQPFTSALVMSNVGWFRYEWIWEKNSASGFVHVASRPMKAHESIVVFANEEPRYYPQKTTGHAPTRSGKSMTNHHYNVPQHTTYQGITDRYPRSVQRFAKDHTSRGIIHPTQKPLALLEYLVKTYTNAGDYVLDFTMGSGTTGHACGNLGRRFIGIEKDAGYFAIASERIATAYAPLRMMQAAL